MRFQDKKVFVTGAGQGIGLGICRAFAHEGAYVGLNDIQEGLAARAAEQLNQEIGQQRVFPYTGDVAQVETIYQMIDEFTNRVGGLDIAFANAGVTHYVEFLNCAPDAFDRVMGVNLRGTYFTAQAAAKKMIAAHIAGRIILVSAIVGRRAFVNFSVYSTTKAGINMMARSLALELGPYGITVNALSPGATLTERTAHEDPNYAYNWGTVNITGRVGTAEDVAAAALFLASPEAGQITGHNLIVDGGWSIRSPLPAEHPEKPVDQDT